MKCLLKAQEKYLAWPEVLYFVLLILPSSQRSTATISIDRFTASFCFRLNDQYIVIFAREVHSEDSDALADWTRRTIYGQLLFTFWL